MTESSEARTREHLIDPALKRTGWDVGNPDQVGIEITADGFDPAARNHLEKKSQGTRPPPPDSSPRM